MDIVKIVCVALLAVVAVLLTRQLNPEFALVVTVASSVLIAVYVCDKLFDVVYTFYDFATFAGLDSGAISCVIKVVGIGYLAEFANNVCLDANCKSVGDKVLLASKISILLCAMPIVERLFSLVKGIVS